MTTNSAPLTMPKSTIQLLSTIVKKTIKLIPKQIGRIALISAGGLLVHTFLLVGPNGGFGRSFGVVGDFVASKGNVIGATMIWVIASASIKFILDKERRSEGLKTLSNIPNEVKASIAQCGELALPIALSGIAIGLGIVALLGNSTAGLLLALVMLFSISKKMNGFAMVLMRFLWQDIQNNRVKKGKLEQPFNETKAYLGGMGFILDLAAGFIVPALEVYYMRITILVIAVVLGIVSYNFFNSRKAGLHIILFGLLLLINFTFVPSVYADDGGWGECGGNITGWINCGMVLPTVIRGIVPSFLLGISWVAAGGISSIISQLISQLVWGDTDAAIQQMVGIIDMAQNALTDPDKTPKIDSCKEAQLYLKAAESGLKEAEKVMDAAYDEAQKSYDELKRTKGTEMFQSIEGAVDELYERVLTEGSLKLSEKLVDASISTAKEFLPDAAGDIALGVLMKFAMAGYYAWKIGEQGAMTSVLVVRNLKTNFLTFGKLLPARIGYDLAYKTLEKAKALVDEFC